MRTSQTAYVASLADALGVVLGAKVPDLGRDIAQALGEGRAGNCSCLREASAALAVLRVEGLEVFPSWEQARQGHRPVPPCQDSVDVGEGMHGWQYHTSRAREQYGLQQHIVPAADVSRRAMLLSQSGPSGSRWLTAMPTSAGTTIEPIRMQVALRRCVRRVFQSFRGRVRQVGRQSLRVQGHGRGVHAQGTSQVTPALSAWFHVVGVGR